MPFKMLNLYFEYTLTTQAMTVLSWGAENFNAYDDFSHYLEHRGPQISISTASDPSTIADSWVGETLNDHQRGCLGLHPP